MEPQQQNGDLKQLTKKISLALHDLTYQVHASKLKYSL